MLILLSLERRERNYLPASTPADGIQNAKVEWESFTDFRMEPDGGGLVLGQCSSIDLAQVYRSSGPMEFLGTINLTCINQKTSFAPNMLQILRGSATAAGEAFQGSFSSSCARSASPLTGEGERTCATS